MTLRTTYEFTLPRGYVDDHGGVHRKGVMRLATARDELAPLRDPTVSGPDDPRLTVLVLTRVIERLGTLDQVNSHVIEGLFAVDLAFLQDFYGVINFGSQEEYEALIAAQESTSLVGQTPPRPVPAESPAAEEPPAVDVAVSETGDHGDGTGDGTGGTGDAEPSYVAPRPSGARSTGSVSYEMPRRP